MISIHCHATCIEECIAIFLRIVIAALREYIHKFLEVYFDDWIVFGLIRSHVENLRLMLDTC